MNGYLKPSEAAQALQIGSRRLWTLTDQGKLPHFRIGRLLRYDPRQLATWLEAQQANRDGTP